MVVDLTLQMVIYHMAMSLFGWLLAIIAGSGVGTLLTVILRYFVKRFPWFPTLLVIFPWRSIAAWIALVLCRSSWMFWQFGLRDPAYSFTIGGVLLVFVIPWVVRTNLGPAYPVDGFGKAVSYGRTLAVLSIALAAFLNFWIGNFLYRASEMSDDQRINQAYLVIGLMLLSVDLLFGLCRVMAARFKLAKSPGLRAP